MPDASLSAFAPDALLDQLGEAVIVTDLDGVVVHWNRAAEDLYGWTAEEAVGRPIDQLTVPDVAQQTAHDIMAALLRGESWSGGFPVRRKDGRGFPALVTDSGVFVDGELVGIIGVSRNLGTAVRPLLERSTDAALVLRSDAVITYASPAVEQLFDWGDEVVGTSIVDRLHPEDRPRLGQLLEEVVARPGAHPPRELRVRAGEEWVWAEAALTNLLDDPVVRGVVCNLRRSLRREALLEAETHVEQLKSALQSRVIIEQAKGFLAARLGITPDKAFEHLRSHARSAQTPVREVARDVVEGRLELTL